MRNSKFKDNEECFKCGSTDHWKQVDPIWKEKGNKIKIARSSNASYDKPFTVMNEECNGQVIANSLGKGSTSVWILDSRCSYHMCSNMSAFDTYEEMKVRKILLADETSCGVLGRGIVKIKMQDDVVWSFSEFIIKGVEVAVLEDKVHKGEVKPWDDVENIFRSVATKKTLLTKVIIEGTPRWVELSTKVE
ncbi:PREDICTED: Retrovirus-related Pol poly from transposon TNT [Prunus dulcis]|uniref:PREDICTED: Retrovirus-related Pol poly from transposon TNT n=1 Tax=Prunus dulcis TaxID=3755 RepID=A0A5E4G3V0_PRUDU|nr:PREDICTED: Retrovirus-related Pol poly from transposon TNT [Prunus dulcis]